MTTFHAVVWTDHKSAHVLQFDAEHVEAEKVKSHSHHTARKSRHTSWTSRWWTIRPRTSSWPWRESTSSSTTA